MTYPLVTTVTNAAVAFYNWLLARTALWAVAIPKFSCAYNASITDTFYH